MMKKLSIKSLLVATAAIFAVSCNPALTVSSDYDRSVDLTSYKTFSIYNLKQSGSVSQLNAERIEKSIRAEMIKKGFTENNNNPDLKVNAITMLKDKQAIVANTSYNNSLSLRTSIYWGMYRDSETTIKKTSYKDGSLVIDVVDAETNKLIWQGRGNAEIDKQPKNPEEVINYAVGKIMSKFPSTTSK